VEFTRGLGNMPRVRALPGVGFTCSPRCDWSPQECCCSREFVVKDCDGRLLAFGGNL
jgi:hypothetical protein